MHSGEVGHTIGHHHPAELFSDDLPRGFAATGKTHWRQKLAVGHLFESFVRTADADEGFDEIVIRRQVFVAERPVFTVAVAAGGSKFVVAVAVAFAAPAEGFSANLPAANPQERLFDGKGVGIFVVVDKKLMAVLVAGKTEPLDGLAPEQGLTVAKTTELHLVGAYVLGEVPRWDPRRAGFEHQNGHS